MRVGNLALIALVAPELLALNSRDAVAAGLYAIQLASQGRADRSREMIALARADGAGSLYTRFANALLARTAGDLDASIRESRAAIGQDPLHPYGWNLLGRAQVEKGELEAARGSFENATKLEPRFQSAQLNLGSAAYLLGDLSTAMGAYEIAVNFASPSDAAFYGLARVYRDLGRMQQALEAAKRAVALNPDRTGALELLGEIQLQLGLFSAAAETGERLVLQKSDRAGLILGRARLSLADPDGAVSALQLAPPSAARSSHLGYAALVAGDPRNAQGLFEECLRQLPSYPGAALARDVARFQQGEAVKIAARAAGVALDPLYEFMRGTTLAAAGEWPEAIASLRASRGLAGNFSLLGVTDSQLREATAAEELRPLALGVLFHVSRFYRPAREMLAHATQASPKSILARHWLARSAHRLGDSAQAIRAHEGALAHAPHFWSSLFLLGDLEMSAGKPQAAVKRYAVAAEVDANLALLIRLGVAYEAVGQEKEAARAYERAIESAPELFVAYNQLAWLYARQGIELSRALELARKADRLRPGNASILDTLGWIHFQLGGHAEALESLEQAHAARSDDAVVLYHLAAVQMALGEREASRQRLEQAFAIAQDFQGAEEARALLRQLQ